jgi:hypothetical protein
MIGLAIVVPAGNPANDFRVNRKATRRRCVEGAVEVVLERCLIDEGGRSHPASVDEPGSV